MDGRNGWKTVCFLHLLNNCQDVKIAFYKKMKMQRCKEFGFSIYIQRVVNVLKLTSKVSDD